MFFAFIAAIFSFDSICMEGRPSFRPAFSISIPQTKYISSDEEESPTSRTSGSSPTRVVRSGSPLNRQSSRHNNLTPRIQQEMQENPRLSPKEKKLTPRSRLIFDYFGDDFFEESTSSPTPATKNHNSNNSPKTARRLTPGSRSNSSQNNSLDRLPLTIRPLPVPLVGPNAILDEVSQLIESQKKDSDLNQRGDAELKPALFSLKKLLDYNEEEKNKALFPGFFNTSKIAQLHKNLPKNLNIQLQIGMITNDSTLVLKCLRASKKPIAALRAKILVAAKILTRKVTNNTLIAKDTKTFINAKNSYYLECLPYARACAPRANLTELLECTPIHDESLRSTYYRGHQVISLAEMLLKAHTLKSAQLATVEQQSEYMLNVGIINNAVWEEFESERIFVDKLNDLLRKIEKHLIIVRLAKRVDLLTPMSDAHTEVVKLIQTFDYKENLA